VLAHDPDWLGLDAAARIRLSADLAAPGAARQVASATSDLTSGVRDAAALVGSSQIGVCAALCVPALIAVGRPKPLDQQVRAVEHAADAITQRTRPRRTPDWRRARDDDRTTASGMHRLPPPRLCEPERGPLRLPGPGAAWAAPSVVMTPRAWRSSRAPSAHCCPRSATRATASPPASIKGGLQLDSQGRQCSPVAIAGPALVAGDVEKSLMIKAVRYTDPDLRMPPKERLDAGAVAKFEAWIRLNAPDPRTQAPPAEAWCRCRGRPSPLGLRPAPPGHPAHRHPCRLGPARCDAFVLDRLEKPPAWLRPRPPARRCCCAVPPSISPACRPPRPSSMPSSPTRATRLSRRVIDRLLANPAFGERWARHWLDLARFAESHGFEHDYDRPNAYPYRDFVIQALNQDLPYDRFVSWQLAGDELAPDDNQALAATGFIECRGVADPADQERGREGALRRPRRHALDHLHRHARHHRGLRPLP
jgi:hypothetical protein